MSSPPNTTQLSDSTAELTPLAAPETAEAQNTYGQILRSSALIGGSSVVSIGIGIVRTKAIAVMLGPAGFGLMGLYGSIVDLSISLASLGIGSSGVRQIAESVASGNDARIARTVIVLRRTAVVLGVLGAVFVVVFSGLLSTMTFGSNKHSGAVALLGLAVFFRSLSAGQGALIQGMRRIRDLAAIGTMGTLLGAIISIILVYFLGEPGVAPSLVGTAAMGFAVSWWYSHKVKTQNLVMTRTEIRQEAASLLRLGVAFMISGITTMAAAYAVRAIVLRLDGFEAAGFYSAAWTLGGLYVGIILQAMGADFYPRLVSVVEDHPQCNRLVNEQTQVSLLLAGPGLIATITFAPLVIALFYSATFAEAVEVLRWICLGIGLRVITWPIGFIIVAKNRQAIFAGTEVAWTVVNIGLTSFCVAAFGVNGAGMAFFGSYIFHVLLLFPTVRWLTGFRWSALNRRIGLLFLLSIFGVFIGFETLPLPWAYAFGVLALSTSTVCSLRMLVTLVSLDRVPHFMSRVLRLGRLAE